MKPPVRLLSFVLPILLGCAAVPAAGAATPAGGDSVRAATIGRDAASLPRGPLASATVTACTTGDSAAARSATFSAAMEALPGTSTMSVAFDLYEQSTATSPYVAVSAPGFGVWQSSNRAIASFTANENVVDLPAPAAFRALVRYRWLSRTGHVIRRAERVTKACVETAPSPDLFIVQITHAAGSPAKTNELYDVVIRNSGPGTAGPFEVAFSVGAAPLADQQVAGLAPRSDTTLQFSGPRCTAGAAITAQADPAGAISEPANPSRKITLVCGAGNAANAPSGS
ncbi:MAG TPA: CARDB domain-containing protein [Solirubrobacteraceae bacterium]|nr:CARDB domain-containing protein [Solirubrobacteraceae bacterium]